MFNGTNDVCLGMFFLFLKIFQIFPLKMLVGITIDRWLAVCYPFSIRIHCTVKRARLIVLSTFLFSLFYNLVRFWEYRIDSNGEIVGLLRLV